MAKEKPESGRMWGGDIGNLLTKDWQKQQLQKVQQLLANDVEPFGGEKKVKSNMNLSKVRKSGDVVRHFRTPKPDPGSLFCSATSCTDTKHGDERLLCHFHHRSQRLRDTETCTSLLATSCELTHPRSTES